MPAFLLAIIGESPEEAHPPSNIDGGTFSLIPDDDPWAPASADEPPRLEEPAPAPAPSTPTAPPADDPWSAAFEDPASAFAADGDPLEPTEDPIEPPSAEPEPALPPTNALLPPDDELPSDPIVFESDPSAFESLFVDDGLDDASDLDEDMEGWSAPAPDAVPAPPPEPEPTPASRPSPASAAPAADPFAEDNGDMLALHGTLVPDDLPPEPKPRPAPAATRSPSAKAGRTMPDFGYMFKGYHLFITEQNTVLFGHRYGSLLIDVHEYPCGDDLPEAYRRFLTDKVSERFVPRSDLSRPVPKQLASQGLDPALLAQAFTAL